MNKRIVCIAFVLLQFYQTWAQVTTYRLEIERSVQDSSLWLDIYIQKESGADFALGSSNFDIELNSPSLNIAKTAFFPGDFDSELHPESYESMGFGKQHLLVMNVNTKLKGSGSGELVTKKGRKIGSLKIPILNPCASVSPKWSYSGTEITAFGKEPKALSVRQGATFVDPSPIQLDGGLSETTPTISLHNGKLVSSSPRNNQWFLDGILIPGAKDSVMYPTVPGNYSLEVTYPCIKKNSSSYAVISTGLSDFLVSANFSAQPNPFVGESSIHYTLSCPMYIKLQLFDVNGVLRKELDSGTKYQGSQEFQLKTAELGLPAGTYIVKLRAGDRMGTLKIVALK